jgi:deoxyribonuclease V
MDKNLLRPPVFSAKTAHEAQQRMARLLILEDRLPKRIKHVAGIDVAYAENISVAATAVLEYKSLELVESQTASCITPLPYIPTLLAFREIRPSVICIRKLHMQPDVFLVNGHGYAHPNRCGLASHLGLVLRKPTIGIAKNKLIGKTQKAHKGVALITHNDETIGVKLWAETKRAPIYVSVGHMVSLRTAMEIVEQTTRSDPMPEPLLKAHQTATAEKRKINIQLQTQKVTSENSCQR